MCGKRNRVRHKERERESEGVDIEDRVERLIHRKWTEPHKASFLSELAAVGGGKGIANLN